MPLVTGIVAEIRPRSDARVTVVLRWHLRGLNLDLALRKVALSAEFETRKTARDNSA